MLQNILPFVMEQYLALCVGGFVGTEVAKVRPAKLIQDKFLCENDRLSRTFNSEILKLLKIILDTCEKSPVQITLSKKGIRWLL